MAGPLVSDWRREHVMFFQRCSGSAPSHAQLLRLHDTIALTLCGDALGSISSRTTRPCEGFYCVHLHAMRCFCHCLLSMHGNAVLVVL